MTSFSPPISPPVSNLPATIPVSIGDLAKVKQFIARLAEGYERTYLPDPEAIVLVDGLCVYYDQAHRRRRLLVAEAHAMQQRIDRMVARAALGKVQDKVIQLERRRG